MNSAITENRGVQIPDSQPKETNLMSEHDTPQYSRFGSQNNTHAEITNCAGAGR